MIWGLAWYWYAVIIGLLLPWVTMYRDIRDEFDEGFMWGLKIYLGVSAATVPAMLLLSFVARWFVGKT
jgi:hypothetical protein